MNQILKTFHGTLLPHDKRGTDEEVGGEEMPKCRRQCGPLVLSCWISLLTTIILIMQAIFKWLDNVLENDRFWDLSRKISDKINCNDE